MDPKTLKRNMEQVFHAIKTSTEEGEIPGEAEVGQFVRLARQFHMQADDAWAGEAEDFAHLAAQLQQAVKYRQRGEVSSSSTS
jgi:XXXCH domain-containing protein